VRPNVALRDAGLLVVNEPRDDMRANATNLRSYEAVAWKAGGSAAVMARGGRSVVLRALVFDLFQRLARSDPKRDRTGPRGEEVEAQGRLPGALRRPRGRARRELQRAQPTRRW